MPHLPEWLEVRHDTLPATVRRLRRNRTRLLLAVLLESTVTPPLPLSNRALYNKSDSKEATCYVAQPGRPRARAAPALAMSPILFRQLRNQLPPRGVVDLAQARLRS